MSICKDSKSREISGSELPPGKALSRNVCELDSDAEKQSERKVGTCLQAHTESELRAYQWQVFF